MTMMDHQIYLNSLHFFPVETVVGTSENDASRLLTDEGFKASDRDNSDGF